MKRHEAIAPLSRDHHSSLILAQLLKKDAPMYRDLPDNTKDKATYARQQFSEHINKHFEQEEAILEKVKGIHAEIDMLSAEIIKEHSELRALFELISHTADLDNCLDKLGNQLEGHIRKEERSLFPLLQQHCHEELLQEIHEMLH